MSTARAGRATIDDLYRADGKAELDNGVIVPLMPTGRKPNRIAGRIFRSLDEYAERTGAGEAYTDNMGYTVPVLQSGRQSFSPDASFYSGRFPSNEMRFIAGAPTFAVEVRSEGSYGDAAEEALAEKRADYFAAGTLVVWDVDPLAGCVRVYRSDSPDTPQELARGEAADAEPAVPGWRVSVDWVLDA